MKRDVNLGTPDIPRMNREFLRLGTVGFIVLFVYFVIFPEEPEVSVKLWAIMGSSAGSLLAVLYLPYRDFAKGSVACSLTSPQTFPWVFGAVAVTAAVPVYTESLLPLLTWLGGYLSVGIFYRSWPQMILRIREWLVNLEFLR